MFLQPCFIRKNTPELRKKLEELGYKQIKQLIYYNYIMVENGNIWSCDCIFNPKKLDGKGWSKCIDCKENEDLFLALAALRDDSDRNQWCICIREHLSTPALKAIKIGEWKLNTYVNKLRKCSFWRKATAEEIIRHFSQGMSIEQYKQELKSLEKEFDAKKKALMKEFALSNNPYKIGDILQDHHQILRVERITIDVSYLSQIPKCVYHGTQLTGKLIPKKRQDDAPYMYQGNVTQKLN